RLPMIVAPVLVCAGYFLGAKIGFALKLHPYPISTLWPPNSILLAELLLAPTRSWLILLLAALPAHVAIQLSNGVPVPMLLGWFVSNCSEALIGAVCVRRLTYGRIMELGALMIALLAVSVPVFTWQETGPESIAALLYAPLPFLVWAAVRFGARGASTATLTVALLAIWGAMHRLGPFVGSV